MFLVQGYLPGLMPYTRDPTGNKLKVLTSGRLSSVGTQGKKSLSHRVRCCGHTEKKHFSTEESRSTPRAQASKRRSEVLVGITQVQGVGGRTTMGLALKETDWTSTWTEGFLTEFCRCLLYVLMLSAFPGPVGT